MFAMKQRSWPDGSSVTVFVLPSDHRTHRDFCKKKLSIFPNQLEAMWYRRVYTGTGSAPVQVSDSQTMLRRISDTPGSIGYLADDTISRLQRDNSNDLLKILSVH